MRDYELTVLFPPKLSDKELDKAISELQTLLEKAGAKIKKRLDPVKKGLAYEIDKEREAYYVFLEIESESAKVAKLDEKLRLEEKIIRYLLVNNGR